MMNIFILCLVGPNAPQNLGLVKSDKSSLTIRWSAPIPLLGKRFPIYKYFIEREQSRAHRSGISYPVTGTSDQYTYTLSNLTANTIYKIYVSAYNHAGKGPPISGSFETGG